MLKEIKKTMRKLLFRLQVKKELLQKFLTKDLFKYKNADSQIIICGYPRSGTSLFYNMLASTLTGFYCVTREQSALHSIWKNGNIAAKNPYDTIRLSRGKIQKRNYLNKNIYVIIVIRDLRDVITSKHMHAPDDYMIGFQDETIIITGNYPDYKKDFSGPGILSYYNAIKKILIAPELRSFIVKYEDLINNPDQVQKKLGEHFNLKFDDVFSNYHTKKEKHKIKYTGEKAPLDKKLHKSSSEVTNNYINRWSLPEYRSRILEQFDNNPEFLNILVEYGYEGDHSWYKNFCCVEPDIPTE